MVGALKSLRIAEIASAAKNQFEARSVLRPLLDRYQVLNMLDERPWDVYKELRIAGARELNESVEG
jgi:hypothetical protein